MSGPTSSASEPEVQPFYWLTVCHGSEASDAFLFPQKRMSELLNTYPVLMLPEFPAAIESVGQVASDDPVLPDLCCRRAEQLRQVHGTLRQRFPSEYAHLMARIGIELANEGQPDGNRENRLVNVRTAIACFERVRLMPADQVNLKDLIFAMTHEANMLAMLAGMRQDSPDNMLKAIDRLERAMSLSSDSEERSSLLDQLRQYRAFLKTIGQPEITESDDDDFLRQKAASLRAAGDAHGALKVYDRLVGLNADDLDSWMLRGDLLFELGRFGESVESYSKIVERRGDRADAWAAAARALAAHAKWPECLACADRALRFDRFNQCALAARTAALAHVSPHGGKP
jgi:tetratricopeptide (TPR) repeat protein